MSAQTTLTLTEARNLAEKAVYFLRPYCERIGIVGSVRRGKPDGIHDIEVLCIPKVVMTDGQLAPVNALRPEAVEQLILEGIGFKLGDPDKNGRKAPFSERYYRLRFRDTKFDLFVCLPPAEWGLLKLIRTGPADFSHEFVTRLWDYGLRSRDGHIEDAQGNILPTPEEPDAFKLCRLDYIEPSERTWDKLRRDNQHPATSASIPTSSPSPAQGERTA